MKDNIVNLEVPDHRANGVHLDIFNYILEKVEGMPLASVIGILELIKFEFIEDSGNE